MVEDLLKNSASLIEHIVHKNHERNRIGEIFSGNDTNLTKATAVLLLLGDKHIEDLSSEEPCLILNKRSTKIRQAGDLCCPGGSISHRTDTLLSKLLTLPGFSLSRWPYWRENRDKWPERSKQMAILYATSLRECFEEMRLNPFGVKFLGPVPSQQLHMVTRSMYPMIGWIKRQKRFYPNWEVEKIIYIPLKDLLNPSCYARMRIQVDPHREKEMNRLKEDFLCFVHKDKDQNEILWGATFRVIMQFLELIFEFRPPEIKSLPLVYRKLDENYFGKPA